MLLRDSAHSQRRCTVSAQAKGQLLLLPFGCCRSNKSKWFGSSAVVQLWDFAHSQRHQCRHKVSCCSPLSAAVVPTKQVVFGGLVVVLVRLCSWPEAWPCNHKHKVSCCPLAVVAQEVQTFDEACGCWFVQSGISAPVGHCSQPKLLHCIAASTRSAVTCPLRLLLSEREQAEGRWFACG